MPASPDHVSTGGVDATRDPADMTPDQRRQEIAAILARGVLRLRRSAQTAPGSSPSRSPEDSAETFSYSLEVGAAPRPHAPAIEGTKTLQKGA